MYIWKERFKNWRKGLEFEAYVVFDIVLKYVDLILASFNLLVSQSGVDLRSIDPIPPAMCNKANIIALQIPGVWRLWLRRRRGLWCRGTSWVELLQNGWLPLTICLVAPKKKTKRTSKAKDGDEEDEDEDEEAELDDEDEAASDVPEDEDDDDEDAGDKSKKPAGAEKDRKVKTTKKDEAVPVVDDDDDDEDDE